MEQPKELPSLVAGANLKRLIQKEKLSQTAAAMRLNFSDSRSIRRLYRNGIKNVDEIQRIASAFKVSLMEMLTPID